MRDAIFAEILKDMQSGRDVALLLGDLGIYQANKMLSEYADRAFNLGILEPSMISFAGGLAHVGSLPIVYSITPFITERVLEQIKLDVLYNKNRVILLSAGGTCDYWDLGPTHHAPCDVALLSAYGGMDIYLPFNEQEAQICYRRAVENDKNSSYIRLSTVSGDEMKSCYDDLDVISLCDLLSKEISLPKGQWESIDIDLGPDSVYMAADKRLRPGQGITVRVNSLANIEDILAWCKGNAKPGSTITVRAPFVPPISIIETCSRATRNNADICINMYYVENKFLDRVVPKGDYFTLALKCMQMGGRCRHDI